MHEHRDPQVLTERELRDRLRRLDVSDEVKVQIRGVRQPGDLVVVDGVYTNIDDPCALALQQPYQRDRSHYPGVRALVRASIPSLDALVSRLVEPGCIVHPMHQVAFSKLDPLPAIPDAQRIPHNDAKVQLGGVLYLASTDDNAGGTAFFRHIATGLDGAFGTDTELASTARRCGFAEVDEMMNDLISYRPEANIYREGGSEVWQRTHEVTWRSNRLVLFDARLFHAAIPCDREEYQLRLTQNLFITTEPAHADIRFRAMPCLADTEPGQARAS